MSDPPRINRTAIRNTPTGCWTTSWFGSERSLFHVNWITRSSDDWISTLGVLATVLVWREALVLVQTATVARWSREGFRGCWRRRSRRRPTATHRFATSKARWPHGHGELSLGRSADPWRVAEARDHRLRTHGVPVSPGPTDETVADLAYIPREPHRQPGVRLDGDLVRDRRWRRRRPCSAVPPCSAITRRVVRFKSVGLVDWPPSLQSTSLGWRVAQHQLRRRTRFSTGKDPPTSWAVNLCWLRMGGGSLRW